MATDVIMPQMGESIAEGTITKWLVKVGDSVERDQPLFEISTDKVDAEIPSPEDGVLLEIRFQEGETVPVNEVVAQLGKPGEATGAAAAAPAQAAPAEDEGSPAAAAAPPPAAEAPAPQATAAAAEPEAPASDLEQRVREFSSPLVRRMAQERGVDILKLEGTGIHGRVTKKDLEAHLEAGDQPPAARAPAEAAIATSGAREPELMPAVRREPGTFSVPAYREGERVEIEPMSKIRQITAAHMSYSKATSAHVTTVFHLDLSRVARARRLAKSGFLKAHGTKLTYMPFIFKAVANALKSNPKLNSSVDGTNIVYKKDVNIGMAVALDWGLIVPVIKHADELNLVGLARAANDLADRARAKKLRPEEVQGGTFTVTNPGVFGTLFGMPIINQPQVAILGLGVIEKRPVVDTDSVGNDIIAIKEMSYFAISYDHRIIDGSDADHFMNDVKRTLEEENWSELDAFL